METESFWEQIDLFSDLDVDEEVLEWDEEDWDDEDDFDPDYDSIVRAKWSMDGAATLEEASMMIQGFAQELLNLKAEGWELTQPVEDDYGFITRPKA